MISTWDNIALSTGSACTSAKVEPSHVIQALGFGAERAHSAIRLSVGRFNTDEEISLALARVVAAARQLQKMSVF